jgi:3-dehydroquinate synthetase
MALAARVGAALGVTERGAVDELLGLMDACGLRYGFRGDASCLTELMEADKKNTGGDITLILMEKFGRTVAHRAGAGTIRRILEEQLREGR